MQYDNNVVSYENAVYDRLRMNPRCKKPIIKQINEYLFWCAHVKQMSAMTLHSKESTLRQLIVESGCKDLREFTNAKFDKFVNEEVSRGVSNRTINTKIAHIVAMVKYFRKMGVIDVPLKIPLVPKLKEKPPRRVCYTRAQINRVLKKTTSEMQWLLVRIPFDTGMRISELKNLTVNQICGQRINFIGKGSKAREVWLTKETAERLHNYIDSRGITDRLWLNDWGYPLCVDTVRRIMREAFYRVGYNDFYPHSLRHSFGSDIQRQGADVMVIKEMMGHSNVNTTQKYLHSLDGQLQTLFAKYKA